MTADGWRDRNDLLDALEAERYAPVPSRPPDPEPGPITPEQAAHNLHLLRLASRPNYPEHW